MSSIMPGRATWSMPETASAAPAWVSPCWSRTREEPERARGELADYGLAPAQAVHPAERTGRSVVIDGPVDRYQVIRGGRWFGTLKEVVLPPEDRVGGVVRVIE